MPKRRLIAINNEGVEERIEQEPQQILPEELRNAAQEPENELI